MKRILFLVIGFLMVLGLSACAKEKEEKLEGSLEDILDEIYEKGEYSNDFKEHTIPELIVIEINDENATNFLGTAIEFEEAIASESTWSTSAYSVCLVRVKDGVDIEQAKQDILENVNPFKWICVGVDEDKIIVDNIGDVIILIMTNYEGEAIHNAFLSLIDEK
ncbi:MAG: hypothetical protein WCS78_05710 [Bacilli bacterium]